MSYIPFETSPIPPRPRKSRKSSNSLTVVGAIAIIIAAVGVIPLVAALRGLVISVFWRWFLMPIFPSLEPISIVQSIGLAFFAGIFTMDLHHKLDNKTDNGSASVTNILIVVMNPLMVLGAGWILLQFIS